MPRVRRGALGSVVSAAPLPIRPAASLLVLRDAPGGVELLLMRRAERDNDFRSGACVFPGGVLDAADRHAWRWCFGQDDPQASARLGLPQGALDYFVAALRECFEEAGLLFACDREGRALAPDAARDARLEQGDAGERERDEREPPEPLEDGPRARPWRRRLVAPAGGGAGGEHGVGSEHGARAGILQLLGCAGHVVGVS